MMARDADTAMGGSAGVFQTTHWSLLASARDADPARRRHATETVLSLYWKPVYCYLRRKGLSNDDAKDATQDFFHDVLLGRNLVAQADPGKGRFRALLLTALNRYVCSRRRKEHALRRSPERPQIPINELGAAALGLAVAQPTPEEAFHYAWATELLDTVIAEVRDGCMSGAQETHWLVFRDKVLVPIRDGAAPPASEELCRRHRVADVKTAGNMIVTVKRRFQRALRNRIRRQVDSEQEIDQELSDLMESLSHGAA